MIKIAPSILSADFGRLAEEIRKVENAGADYLHIDVMDGHFVPNISIGPLVVAALRPRTALTFDVHLMIEAPENYVVPFAEAGADILTVHAEATRHLDRTLRFIRQKGMRAGVALNPATSLSVIEYVLPVVDQVLLMTVNPVFGGQRFLEEVLPKIDALRRLIDGRGCCPDLEVDGGIGPETVSAAVQAGANILVAGSAVFGAGDAATAIKRLRQAATNESDFFNKND
ncbi:MAG: ribulose-phosphate 3-epimerase [Candidatus Desulforudis sp.]|nr:ribulose-phosphate 3-epimerase [Desulforudis sp.]